MSPSAKILAALACLSLFETTSAPAGPVRRCSLFGYLLGAGDEVLSLEEAAARAAVPAGRPGLVRIAPLPELEPPPSPLQMYGHSANDDGGDPPSTIEDSDDLVHEQVPPRVYELEDEPAPVSEARPVGSDVDLEPAFDTDTAADAGDEIEPAEALAKLCTHCHGGERYRRTGCMDCHGYSVLVFVGDRKITTDRPPRTDEERIGGVDVLSDLFSSLDDRQRRGALDLFHLIVRGASPACRTQALAQWRFAQRNEGFGLYMQGAERERIDAAGAAWGTPANEGGA